MVLAVVIGVLAALAALLLVIALFNIKRNKKGNIAEKQQLSEVQSVGVSSEIEPDAPASQQTHVKRESHSAEGLLPSMKKRFAIAGGVAAFFFSVLGIRSFYLQVLNNALFASKSNENSTASVSTPAPRGCIYDRSGLCLVGNENSLCVLADSDVESNNTTVARLSAVLGVPRNVIRHRIQNASSGAQSQRVVAEGVNFRDVAFITEHADAFAGVSVDTRTVRKYPYAALGAHVLGYVGSVSPEELAKIPAGRDIQSGDKVGKSGVEQQYDSLLSGEHGVKKVVTDAEGNVHSVVSQTEPSKGSDIYLTIAAPVQYAADTELRNLVAPYGNIGTGTGVAASLVCMDVRDGGIIALSNYPTYNPSAFTDGIPEDIWDLYTKEESHYPFVNRAIAGSYPAASTYKAFTSLAGLAYGFASYGSTWTCTGSWDGFNSGLVQNCWNHNGHGTLDLHGGIVNSCDVVFYEIAKQFYFAGISQGGTLSDTAMQEVLEKFNYGRLTGIDLSGEECGRIPTPKWKAEFFKDAPEDAKWQGGDLTNMVIGQGYVLVTPIQQAVAYGAIATGKLMKPHLLREVRNSNNEVVLSFEPQEIGRPQVSQDHLQYVQNSLVDVAKTNFPSQFHEAGITGACKTGTAEVSGKPDFSWFCAYAPADDPKFVVAAVNEESGGGNNMAQAAIKVLASAVNYDEGLLQDVGSIEASTGKSVANSASASSSGSRQD